MEKYLVPPNTVSEIPKSVKRQKNFKPRRPWKRSLVELNGRVDPSYRHYLSSLIIQSYSKNGVFPHKYHVNGEPCQTHVDWFINSGLSDHSIPVTSQGISSLEFDSKGVYLASATKSGCITIHDFDNICNPDLEEDEGKQLLHISTCKQIDVLRWNLANQDEARKSLFRLYSLSQFCVFGICVLLGVYPSRIGFIWSNLSNSTTLLWEMRIPQANALSFHSFVSVVASTSMRSSEIHIFDIGYISSEPVEVLRKRPNITVHGLYVHKGFSDIAFTSDDNSRLLASDTNGVINIWDRRVSNLPCLELTTNSTGLLNSIKLSGDNEIVYGASKQGTIFIWDLRGGRSHSTFRNHKEEYHSPLIAVKLAHELEKISSLKAQANIVPKEIHSVDIDPSCPYQLAFHLDDGWSGILDTNKLQVTHIHCPPPPWLDEPNGLTNLSYLKRPCWLPINSIYAVGSLSSDGLYLLDFYPDCTSPCHVDYNEDMGGEEASIRLKQNRHLALPESVTACAAHPVNATIVAGTKLSSLLVISS